MRNWIEVMRAALAAFVIVTTVLGPVADVARDHVQGGAYPVCASEDEGGPCVWIADEQGNGRGQSFVIREAGRVEYVSHDVARLWAGRAAR